MKITMYSTATCAFCLMLKKYLEEKNLAYEVKMADEDENIAQELYEKSQGFTVPFTEIVKDDGSVENVLGFDVPKLNAALGIQ